MVILDTDHLSLMEWETSAGAAPLRRRLLEHDSKEICTTIISYEEQVRGWLSTLNACKKVADQIEAYRRLNRQLRLYCGVNVVDFDEAAATEFQRLRKLKLRIGTMDLRIAAIVLTRGALLLTRNRRDFAQVPSLLQEDWTR